MRFSDLTKALLIVAATATAANTAFAKPNSYPGENSRFKSSDPAVIAQQKAERQKRVDERKARREQRRQERLNRKNNRSN
ncbi:hypothetical protein J7394_14370 [Ruegeria sp. R13_0]|uniref:hypothetical protein n=1 Tax=Ruegeria sp. R13_0 TaxID=2821099 RepID=UPI001AD95FCC|nr:hypothetical protein [Ruegeria sp. R13_0]MBO9435399.1 hypothetical protein [Ruegeria sp. R13_0]